MTLPNRTQDARNCLAQGDLKGCLAILKDFRMMLTAEERACFQRGWECIVRPEFYRQMKVDCQVQINKAKAQAEAYLERRTCQSRE